jgi:hypothetical protein
MKRALAILAVALLVPAASAAAAEIQVFQSSFDGTGSSSGRFAAAGIQGIAIDRSSDLVYVGDSLKGVADKFDLEGNPIPFSGTGKTTVQAKGGVVAVDNSAQASHGNLYVADLFVSLAGFSPDGNPLGGNFPLNGSETFLCNVNVGPNGNLFVNAIFAGGAIEYTPQGEPTGTTIPVGSSCPSTIDEDGNFYAGSFTEVTVFDASNGYARVEPAIAALSGITALAVDPTTDELYVDVGDHINIYGRGPTLEGPWQQVGTLEGFVASNGLAFDSAGDLYVAETGVPGDATSTRVDIFKPQPESTPVIKRQFATEVRSTGAKLGTQLVAAGTDTSYRVEYGTDTAYGSTTETVHLGARATPYTSSVQIQGLAPDTTYHYRVVATNAKGDSTGVDRTFKTYATPPGGVDPCPNALARKQTGARNLLDCRAYELVSARNTDSYDVESLLAPGESPYPGYPLADSKVLYAVHAGVIPGLGNPTNHGPDPYLAKRGADGWSSSYVGIPADIDPKAGPFSSTLAEADSKLDAFAFAGPELCHPCFDNGVATGMPLRLGDGGLTQGLAGTLDPGPSAEPEGRVAKRFSADGSHLVFATAAKLEPDANSNGDLTVYERDLAAGTTTVVSKAPTGQTMTGAGIAELDVSGDGSRVVVAQRAGEDTAGNALWHPYMNVEGVGHGVDLAPGASAGVLFDGMTSDGSRAFFTSPESLLPGDGDAAADIYEASVSGTGAVDLRLVSAAAGAEPSCDPVADEGRAHWNSPAATADCGAVAIAGGGGVAGASGDIYFLSPQVLADRGVQDEPNLYLGNADGTVDLVATLEPENPIVVDSVAAAEAHRTADFETTPDGGFAAFPSALPLAGPTGESLQVVRFDRATGKLACGSCDPSGAEEPGTQGDASMAAAGLSLTDDGRLFFTTPAPLVLNDTDRRLDVYEMSDGAPQLISSGISQFDSALLSVSADGVDVYFFTHDRLAPAEDENGTLARIYDARVNGGFFSIPVPPPCAASDECHGAGTTPPGPADIKSAVPGSDGNEPPAGHARACPKGKVLKHGRCVKKKKRHHAHGRKGGKHGR